jgi:hypothetical protein
MRLDLLSSRRETEIFGRTKSRAGMPEQEPTRRGM